MPVDGLHSIAGKEDRVFDFLIDSKIRDGKTIIVL
jgi:hypothetical protein